MVGVALLAGGCGGYTGTEIIYYVDGPKVVEDGPKEYETPYVNGKMHGTQIRYREDGSKWVETPYVNGKAHGKQIIYNEDGSKKSETVWENGKAVSGKEF